MDAEVIKKEACGKMYYENAKPNIAKCSFYLTHQIFQTLRRLITTYFLFDQRPWG